ncbi:hypothetical protein [Kiloniella majae]|uniref:hypothetical protein n=1 Tax=Kiloniella majae TaxID=1938558 RepID=UPI000A277A27|nr:hypothetical protein [Kiloniella majae]
MAASDKKTKHYIENSGTFTVSKGSRGKFTRIKKYKREGELPSFLTRQASENSVPPSFGRISNEAAKALLEATKAIAHAQAEDETATEYPGLDWADMDSELDEEAAEEQYETTPAGEGEHDEMEERVAKLETHFEYIRRDMDDIRNDIKDTNKEIRGLRDDQRAIILSLAKMPSRTALFGYTATVASLCIAVVAIFVGVLSYIGTISG